MRQLLKLVRCGNATHITVPRAALFHLGWLPGQQVIFELLEDQTIRVRRPTPEDFASISMPSLKLSNEVTAAK